MYLWNQAIVVITGAGSGIGRALALALAKRGARVVVTDVDGNAVARVAAECAKLAPRQTGEPAQAMVLDVVDAGAVQTCIDLVVREHGRIDYLFNNAGIGIGGEAFEIPLVSWNRIVDINLRGVIHGITAAYPIMVRQRSGHIINTASLAGLAPAPLLAPYGMTKHAVVGLSTSLRLEAQKLGVRISVLCPAAIETPLLDAVTPAGLPDTPWVPDIRRFLTRMAGPPYPVERCAEDAIRAIERNRGVIVLPRQARLLWLIARWFPWLVGKVALRIVAAERATRNNAA